MTMIFYSSFMEVFKVLTYISFKTTNSFVVMHDMNKGLMMK